VPSLALIVILPMMFLASSALAQEDFPEGKAKESACNFIPRAAFQPEVDGIRLEENDRPYGDEGCSWNFGAIRAIVAHGEELVSVIGLTPSGAKTLIAFRGKHGEFMQWGDTLVIYGVGGFKIEAAKDKMTFWLHGQAAV
jgi:hypothetical protein